MDRIDPLARLAGTVVAVLAVVYFGAHVAVAQPSALASLAVATGTVAVALGIVAILDR